MYICTCISYNVCRMEFFFYADTQILLRAMYDVCVLCARCAMVKPDNMEKCMRPRAHFKYMDYMCMSVYMCEHTLSQTYIRITL